MCHHCCCDDKPLEAKDLSTSELIAELEDRGCHIIEYRPKWESRLQCQAAYERVMTPRKRLQEDEAWKANLK